MARTCCNAEQSRNYNVMFQSVRNSIISEYGGLTVGESVASSAVKTAIDVHASLIVILSESGKLAGYVSKFRPGVSALMLTPKLKAARQASGLFLGMHTIEVDSLERSEELIEEVHYELLQQNMMQKGDKIIVIGGRAASMQERLLVTVLDEGKDHQRFVKGGGLFFNRGLLLSFGHH